MISDLTFENTESVCCLSTSVAGRYFSDGVSVFT